jgi:hypothetical protein
MSVETNLELYHDECVYTLQIELLLWISGWTLINGSKFIMPDKAQNIQPPQYILHDNTTAKEIGLRKFFFIATLLHCLLSQSQDDCTTLAYSIYHLRRLFWTLDYENSPIRCRWIEQG